MLIMVYLHLLVSTQHKHLKGRCPPARPPTAIPTAASSIPTAVPTAAGSTATGAISQATTKVSHVVGWVELASIAIVPTAEVSFLNLKGFWLAVHVAVHVAAHVMPSM